MRPGEVMNTIAYIFFKPKSVFEHLSHKFDHSLNARNNLLFILSGLVIGTRNFFKDVVTTEAHPGILVIGIAISGAGSLVVGKYIVSPIIIGIGKLLKGKSELIDIRTVVAYAQIPIILTLPMILYLGLNDRYVQLTNTELWIINKVNAIVWIVSTNISIRGLAFYNKYGVGKALLNLTPFWLIGLAWWVYFLYVILQ